MSNHCSNVSYFPIRKSYYLVKAKPKKNPHKKQEEAEPKEAERRKKKFRSKIYHTYFT